MGTSHAGDDELIATGLLDPHDPHAPERRQLLRWLAERGFSVEEMRAAAEAGDLAALAGDSARRADITLTPADISARTGIPLGRLVEMRRTAGLPPVDPDVPVYTESELAAFEQLGAAGEMFSWDELMAFLRVVGSSLARIADAANTLFLHEVEQPLVAAGATELDLAHTSLRGTQLAAGVSSMLDMLFRQHLEESIDWTRRAHHHAAGPGLVVPMAVGFVDLVGFTGQSSELQAEALAALVARFERTAHDIVTERGGRLVKLIGDEVMFVSVDAHTACAIALHLLTAFGDDDELTPRGGLAYGDVLARAGDFFGPTVNLAARLTEQAVPGEVLATPEAAESAAHHAQPAGRRLLKGFAEPIQVVSLTP